MSNTRTSYLSPPQMHALDIACIPLRVFGVPYLVGSVNTRRDYRDVDVRLILPDDDTMLAFGENRLRALNYVISRYLMDASGLPVDFQFQSRSAVNETGYGTKPNPLGVRWYSVMSEAQDGEA